MIENASTEFYFQSMSFYLSSMSLMNAAYFQISVKN